jgi:predicted metal-dependent enzyme (double-stranded beta helix superfamily)
MSITSDTTLDTNRTLARAGSSLTALVAAVRQAVSAQADWAGTAELVADALRRHLPGPEVLTPEQRRGDPERFQSHTLHVETGGSFSVVAFVWRPGQVTRIHDHLTWCVFGVVQGIEHEELFDAHGTRLGESSNHPGEVSGFAPPGDIHRVRNIGSTTAISIHVYGTDVDRVGSSVRRYYDDER